MRKSKYEKTIVDNIEYLETMIIEGMQDKEIYSNLGISSATWFKWKKEKSELIELYEKISQQKQNKLPEVIEEYTQMKSIAESKLMEALELGQEWAIKYVLDTHEEHTPYHKIASIKLREREIEVKSREVDAMVQITKVVGDDPLE